ncbi:DOPP1-like protein, partial [Mya arenaria]
MSLIVAFLTLVIFRRDLHTISYFAGLLLNEALNWLLKHTIRENRPQREISVLFTEYGMPSSHAQFMYFFATYLVFFLFIRVYRNYKWVEDLWKYILILGGYTCATLVAYSSQVIWGGVVGLVLGCVWFAVVQIILTPFFPYIAA